MAGKKSYKPGETVPFSGQYKNTGTGYEVTSVEGKKFPPTPQKGDRYIPVDKTRHKK